MTAPVEIDGAPVAPIDDLITERKRRRVCYLAAPVAAPTVDDVRANLARAKRWLWWLRCNTGWSISASWIPAVEAVLDSGAPEEAERQRGLADDVAQVERCDAIVLVGGRVSAGMQIEAAHAVASGVEVIDLTEACGVEPPVDGSPRGERALALIEERRIA